MYFFFFNDTATTEIYTLSLTTLFRSTEIARLTGGRYFRATDKEKLQAIYDEINQLEKSRVEVTERITYHELFLGWVLAALALLTAELLLSNLVLKRIP